MRARRAGQAGISLVEAMVALAVMAFGSLAILGLQSNLRLNADVARQRSEAVRIAQESMETTRHFEALADFEDLAGDESTIEGINASFTLSRAVTTDDERARKTVIVEVRWTDRSGAEQQVRLVSDVHGVPPALAGSLGVPSDKAASRQPRGRSPAIPPSAVDHGDGTSGFTPPGASGISWTFNNTSGFITQFCVGTVCTEVNARLLAGFVVFATDATQPTPAQAEIPPSPRPTGLTIGAEVTLVSPLDQTPVCYADQSATAYVAYYCAIPLGLQSTWTGRSNLTGLTLAASIADGTASAYRVCRYTLYQDHRTAPGNIRNADHPLNYVLVDSSLVQQNFLVIKAGTAADSAFGCPDDDTSTPFVFGRTWHHQPSS
jgi:Tfp pilus assembly protein PilV